jgi:hypothetical protein
MLTQNLKKFNITEVRVSFKAKLTEELLGKLKSFTPDEEGDYVFIERYKSEGVGHVATALVSLNEDNTEFSCRLLYRVRKGGRSRKSIPGISQLLDIVSAIQERVEFSCLLRFTFSKRTKTSMLINLPLKVTDKINAPFSEIYGAHFVKREGKQVKYEVILDFSEESGMLGTFVFETKDRISESVVEKIIQKGVGISKIFVSKEELE